MEIPAPGEVATVEQTGNVTVGGIFDRPLNLTVTRYGHPVAGLRAIRVGRVEVEYPIASNTNTNYP